MQAIQNWNTSVIVQLQPRHEAVDDDYVFFTPSPASNFSEVGRVGGQQIIACALPATNVVPQDARFALAHQREGLLVGAFIGIDGGLWITWVEGLGDWEGPVPVNGSVGLFLPGRDVALVQHGEGVLAAAAFDGSGALRVSWTQGVNGEWAAPISITPSGFGAAGGGVALVRRSDAEVALLCVAADRRLHVALSGAPGAWNAPAAMGAPFARSGAGVAAAMQEKDVLVAAIIGADQQLNIAFVDGANRVGPGPVAGGMPFAVDGAPVAMGWQDDDLLVAAAIGVDQKLWVGFVEGRRGWSPAGPVVNNFGAPAAAATRGQQLALVRQGDKQITAAAIDANGSMTLAWAVDRNPWQGPSPLPPPNSALPGSGIALAGQAPGRVTALLGSLNSILQTATETADDAKPWDGPNAFTNSGARLGTVLHEIGHAIGLIHEHQRPDRAGIVQVNPASVIQKPEILKDFAIRNNQAILTGYDCLSIMHYSRNAFFDAQRKPPPPVSPIVPLNPAVCPTMQPVVGPPAPNFVGQRFALTALDIRGINYLYGQCAPSPARCAVLRQTEQNLTALCVDQFGRLCVSWHQEGDGWFGPLPVGQGAAAAPAGAALVPGAPVAAAFLGGDTNVAVSIDATGQLAVSWADDVSTWRGPVAVGGVATKPGGGVALAQQSDDTLTAMFIGNGGRTAVAWVERGKDWNAPVFVAAARFQNFPAGADVAMARQHDNVTIAMAASGDGLLMLTKNVDNAGWTDWERVYNGPLPFARAVPGTPIALAKQARDVLVAAFIDNRGQLAISFAVGNGPWSRPGAIGGPFALPGSPVALGQQAENMLTAAAIGLDGSLYIAWVDDLGVDWRAPISIGAPQQAPFPARGGVALGNQPDAFVAVAPDSMGHMTVAWTTGGPWNPPTRLF